MSEHVFQTIITRLKADAPEGLARGMLDQCLFLDANEHTLTIALSGEHTEEYIRKHFLEKMYSLAHEIGGTPLEIAFEIRPDLDYMKMLGEKESKTPRPETEDIISAARARAHLDSHLTFANFVKGINYDYPVGVAMAIAEEPGTRYNPFYIYGGVGIGKTHISQAVGNAVLEQNPRARVLYIDSKDFVNEFVNGLHPGSNNVNRSTQMNRFKEKYRSLDVFILDDIERLQSAEQTSQEFFSIFQELDHRKKQMIFVSDRPPRKLNNIDARLTNRFEKSVITEIEPPRLETRMAIIKMKLQELDARMDESIIRYLAENITTDVRKLLGAITAYITRKSVLGLELDVQGCIELGIFKDYLTERGLGEITRASVADIINATAEVFEMSAESLMGESRTKYIAHARMLAMYLARELSDRSTTEIGLEFGGRAHATVVSATNKIKTELETNEYLQTELKKIKRVLASRSGSSL